VQFCTGVSFGYFLFVKSAVHVEQSVSQSVCMTHTSVIASLLLM